MNIIKTIYKQMLMYMNSKNMSLVVVECLSFFICDLPKKI